MPRRALPITLLAGLAPALAGGQVPLGSEFQANFYTTGAQSLPATTSSPGATTRPVRPAIRPRSWSAPTPPPPRDSWPRPRT
jgi:hypothetical protein